MNNLVFASVKRVSGLKKKVSRSISSSVVINLLTDPLSKFPPGSVNSHVPRPRFNSA